MTISDTDREALLTAIAPRIETVVARTVQRAKETVAEYAVVDEEELKAGIVADLQRAMVALLEERELTEADRAGMSEIGDARARAGIPMEAMLRVYRYTIDEVFNGLWEASDEGAVPPEAVIRITRLIWHYADPMMDVAVEAYRRRELQQAVADTQDRTALVHGLLLNTGGIEQIDPTLGAHLDPTASYLAVRARSGGSQRDLLLDLGTAGVLEGGAAAPHQGDVIGFARRSPSVGQLHDAVIGVGPAGPLHELPHSYAVASRVVATADAFGRTGVFTIDDLALEAIARAESTITRRLVDRYVTPCEPGSAAGAELLETLRVHMAHDLSVDATAAELFVHPNTVRNRLRRYEQLTHSNLRSVEHLAPMRLALLGFDLAQRRSDRPS